MIPVVGGLAAEPKRKIARGAIISKIHKLRWFCYQTTPKKTERHCQWCIPKRCFNGKRSNMENCFEPMLWILGDLLVGSTRISREWSQKMGSKNKKQTIIQKSSQKSLQLLVSTKHPNWNHWSTLPVLQKKTFSPTLPTVQYVLLIQMRLWIAMERHRSPNALWKSSRACHSECSLASVLRRSPNGTLGENKRSLLEKMLIIVVVSDFLAFFRQPSSFWFWIF